MVINLLPEEEKRELEREKTWRRIFVVLIFLLISMLVFILILFPLKIYISSKTESLENLVSEKEEVLKELKFEDFQEVIKETNQDLSKIQKFWQQQLLITPFFERFSSLVPSSIYLTSFSFQKKIQKEIFAEIRVSGWAENRENLFYFKETLEEEESFKEVYFSPACWVKPIDIDFSLSFKFNPNDFK